MNRSLSRERPQRSKSPPRTKSAASRRLQIPTKVSLSQERPLSKAVNDPTPDVGEWRRSLRSPSPSAAGHHTTGLRLSPVTARKDVELGGTTDTADFHIFQQNLDRSLSGTADLEREYIESLRQQISILELDNKYLRDQGLKITEMHPAMKMEAEAMLQKLKELQKKLDGMDLEMFRKNGDIDRLDKVYTHLSGRAKDDIGIGVKEKTLLVEDAARLKTEKDAAERSRVKCELILQDLTSDHKANLNSLLTAETKAETLKQKLESECSTTQALEKQLLELRERLGAKMAELSNSERLSLTLQPLPEDERLQQQMRQEVEQLRSELLLRRSQTDSDLTSRDELSKSVSRMSKENVNLSQLLSQMRSDVERNRSLKSKQDLERSSHSLEISRTHANVSELSGENARLKAELQDARSQNLRALDTLKLHEARASQTLRDSTISQRRLTDLDGHRKVLTEENSRLQSEKNFLLDRVESLQMKISERSKESLVLDQHASSLARKMEELERLLKMEQSVQSQRWTALGRLADDIRGFAHRGRASEATGSVKFNGDYNHTKYS